MSTDSIREDAAAAGVCTVRSAPKVAACEDGSIPDGLY